MYLKVIGTVCNYVITLDSPITVVIGDTSTGKSNLTGVLRAHSYTSLQTDATIVYTDFKADFISGVQPGTLLVIDLDSEPNPSLLDALVKCGRDDIYALIFGRRWLERLPLNCDNMCRLITVKGITKNVPFYDKELVSYTEFSKVITEDSGSGNNYACSVFGSAESAKGASNLLNYKYKDYLKIFDTVGFGAYLEEFLDLHLGTAFLGWPSFEGYILEEVYSEDLSKYSGVNKEELLTARLHELNPQYGKSTACYSQDCYACDKPCSINAKQVFKNSKYSKFLELQKQLGNDLDAILNELHIDRSYREQIEKYLPQAKVSKETLRSNVTVIARDFLNII